MITQTVRTEMNKRVVIKVLEKKKDKKSGMLAQSSFGLKVERILFCMFIVHSKNDKRTH